jgi:hypothetical protein
MEKHPSRRLRRELETIRGAVEAARILSEAVATAQLGPERDHRRAPRAISCLLALVDQRLGEVRRAVRRGGAIRGVRAQDIAGRSRMSPDERVLALCAMRQRRAGGANRIFVSYGDTSGSRLDAKQQP